MGGGARPSRMGAALALLSVLTAACGGGGSSAKPGATVTTGPSSTASVTGKTLPLIDDFDDDGNGWGTESNPQVGVSMKDGVYAWVVRQEPTRSIEHYPEALVDEAKAGHLDDVHIEARVSFTSPGSALLGCYEAPTVNVLPGTTGYAFAILPEGHGVILKGAPGGSQPLAASAADPSNPTATPPVFDFEENKPLTFAAECQRRPDSSVDLRLYVNGRQVLQTTDTTRPHRSGIVSIGAGKSSAALKRLGGFREYTISWDSVRISRL